MKYGIDVPLKINCINSGDPLTFHLAPSLGLMKKVFIIRSKIITLMNDKCFFYDQISVNLI